MQMVHPFNRTSAATAARLVELGAWSLTADGVLWCSREALALLGWSQGTSLGLDDLLHRLVQEGDRRQLRAVFDAILAEGGHFDSDLEVRTLAGSLRWIRLVTEGHCDERGPRLQGAMMDATERRRSQERSRIGDERFRLLANATHDAIWDWDVTTDVVWRSEGFAAHFNVSDLTPEMSAWVLLIHPEDRDRVLQGLRGVLEMGGAEWTAEYRLRRGDGQWAFVMDRGYVVRDHRGQPVRIVGILSDVTAQRASERQIHERLRMETVGRLAGGIAHDFNNILSIVIGTADLCLEDIAPDHPLRPALTDIRQSGARAADLTRQLLAFGRRQVLQPRVLNLNTVIGDLLPMVRRLIGEHIDVQFVPGADLGRVQADPSQLTQVLLNLAANARDAMPDGGRLVISSANVDLDDEHAALHPTVVPGPHVMLVVSDTGVGIAPEALPHIFEPFFTTKSRGQGTGLGLSTVYGVVKQSGGSIWVYSEVGQGTTFKIYLPRAEAAHTSAAPGEPHLVSGTATVLVVEDEPTLRRLATRILSTAGYAVLTAGSGPEALALLETPGQVVDLLFTDVVMPGMSGPALAAVVTARYPSIKVVFASGYTDETLEHHRLLAGDVALVAKPYSAAELTAQLRDVLAGPSSAAMAGEGST